MDRHWNLWLDCLSFKDSDDQGDIVDNDVDSNNNNNNNDDDNVDDDDDVKYNVHM